MSKGKWRTTKDRTSTAKNVIVDFPLMTRSDVVKQVMLFCRCSYSQANKAVNRACALYPNQTKRIV